MLSHCAAAIFRACKSGVPELTRVASWWKNDSVSSSFAPLCGFFEIRAWATTHSSNGNLHLAVSRTTAESATTRRPPRAGRSRVVSSTSLLHPRPSLMAGSAARRFTSGTMLQIEHTAVCPTGCAL